MSVATHTPGPWEVQDPMGPDLSIVQAGLEPYDWTFIAHIPAGHHAEQLFPLQTAEANARLIAAAPDLLDALTLALPYVEEAERDPAYKPGVVAKLTKQIREAIGKAEVNP